MPWKDVRIGSLVKDGALAINDGYRMRNVELGASGIPFVRGGDIRDGWIDTETQDHIRSEFRDRVQAKLAQPGDVALITKGTVGRVGWLREGQPRIVFAPQVAYWRVLNSNVLDPRFLFYLLKDVRFQAELDAVKTPGAMAADYVSIRRQHDLRLPIPPIKDQRAIAHILGTLDDKIELNRRINQTLEEIARTLFKSWFVDFDPVRAKAEGRPPEGMDAETAALFPDTFEESELGPIPKGWLAQPIGDIVRIVGGSTPSTKNPSYWDGGDIPWATPEDLSRTESPILLKTERSVTRIGLENIGSGLLLSGTVLLSSRAPIGHLAISRIDLAINQDFIAMLPSERLPSAYLLFWSRLNLPRILSRAGLTTFPEISKRDFRSLLTVVPPAGLTFRFAKLVESLFRKITANHVEANSLVTARDALLPRLLSGEIIADLQSNESTLP